MKAIKHGFKVISESKDKSHGLRESYIIDSAGYCWVPCKEIWLGNSIITYPSSMVLGNHFHVMKIGNTF